MTTIRYEDSSYTLRLEFPSSWPVKTACPTGVTIAIADTAGSAVLAATAATITSPTTLTSAASIGATALAVFDSTAFTPGDRWLIEADGSNPAEVVEVVNSTATKTPTLKRPLEYTHESGADIRPIFATYALDASDTDDFPRGADLLITWTPNTDAPLFEELARVEDAEWGSQGLQEELESYPIASKLIGDDYDEYYTRARRKIKTRLQAEGLDLDTLREPDAATESILDEMIVLAYRQTSALDQYQAELKDARETAAASLLALIQVARWWDEDRDGKKDEGEVRPRSSPVIPRGY